MLADLAPAPRIPMAADAGDGLAFLRSRLVHPVNVRGMPALAIAETAKRFNDSRWFWTDDNAKALEFLALPAVRNADPGLTDGVLDFVLAMSPDDLIWRRLSPPQLQAQRLDPRDFLVITALHRFEGDLSRGVVRQAVRFNDGRSRIAAVHSGHLVEFRLGGRRHCVDVEDSITDYGLVRSGSGITLFHESTIRVPTGLLGGRPQPVATLRYAYEIRADSPVFRLQVTLRATAGITLTALRLTTASDEMSDSLRTCRIGTAGRYAAPPLPPNGTAYVHRGPLDHLVLGETGSPGFAHALHLRPLQPESVVSLSITTREGGRPHWALLRYALPELAAGAEFAVAEDRLLLAGGSPAQAGTVGTLLREPEALAGIDPSASYDHGAELNAVAAYWAHATAGAYAALVPPERLGALQSWFDRHVDAFFASVTAAGDAGGAPVFVRGLCFVILALDTMHRASGEVRYQLALGAALDLLLQRQQGGGNEGLFLDSDSQLAFLDCHAAGILALARLVGPGCDGRVLPALRRALGALRLGTITAEVGDATLPYDTIVVRSRAADGGWHEDGAYWTYKAALLLRALRAVLARRASGLLALTAAEADRAAALARLCRDRLAATGRRHADGLEHLTGPHAGETNSETQAWVLLAAAAQDVGRPESRPESGREAPSAGPADAGARDRTPDAETLHEARALRLNLKVLGSALARAQLAARDGAEAAAAPAGPHRIGLGSRICCQADIEQDWLRHWCRVLGLAPRYHRKLWEDCFVPQALWDAGMLEPGRRGLGFAVGVEDLPAFFAGRGIAVLATDLDAADGRASAWVDSGQHASRLESLHRPRLGGEAEFRRLVSFRPVDMTGIPADLLQGGFDFVWSVCALEHLGSLEAGEAFIRTAMRCLRPGGIAVHTTEHNLNPHGPTLEAGPTVLYQRRHFDRLARDLASDGHHMLPLQETPGDGQLFDRLVDLPPYPQEGGPEDSPHLRLVLAGHTITSAGLVIRAGTAG